jgi:hypothetical protein
MYSASCIYYRASSAATTVSPSPEASNVSLRVLQAGRARWTSALPRFTRKRQTTCKAVALIDCWKVSSMCWRELCVRDDDQVWGVGRAGPRRGVVPLRRPRARERGSRHDCVHFHHSVVVRPLLRWLSGRVVSGVRAVSMSQCRYNS